jgi:hypothetical protein
MENEANVFIILLDKLHLQGRSLRNVAADLGISVRQFAAPPIKSVVLVALCR